MAALIVIGAAPRGNAAPTPPPAPAARVVESAQLDPALLPVCSCESTGRSDRAPKQFNADGTVIHGRINPHDIGMCQINEDIWGATAQKLGFDIYTEQGNIKMANWILEHDSRGIENWSWSKSCWDK